MNLKLLTINTIGSSSCHQLFKREVNGEIKRLEGDGASSEDGLRSLQRPFCLCPQRIRTLRGLLLFLLSVKLASALGFHRTVANSAALLAATLSSLFWPTVGALAPRPEKGTKLPKVENAPTFANHRMRNNSSVVIMWRFHLVNIIFSGCRGGKVLKMTFVSSSRFQDSS